MLIFSQLAEPEDFWKRETLKYSALRIWFVFEPKYCLAARNANLPLLLVAVRNNCQSTESSTPRCTEVPQIWQVGAYNGTFGSLFCYLRDLLFCGLLDFQGFFTPKVESYRRQLREFFIVSSLRYLTIKCCLPFREHLPAQTTFTLGAVRLHELHNLAVYDRSTCCDSAISDSNRRFSSFN